MQAFGMKGGSTAWPLCPPFHAPDFDGAAARARHQPARLALAQRQAGRQGVSARFHWCKSPRAMLQHSQRHCAAEQPAL